MSEHEHGKPDPACILAVKQMVEQTSEATASRVERMLVPLFDRMARLEGKVDGNGLPGLNERMRTMERAHEDMVRQHMDAVKLRRQIWFLVAGHAVTVIAAIIWAAQWVAKVNAFMSHSGFSAGM